MTNLRIAIVAGLVLFAGGASAASRGGPPLTDLTGCCGTIHKAEHEKAQQRALQVPDRDRGKVLADTDCNMYRQAPAPTTVDPKYRR
jgi:hypothetical protein